MKWVLGCAASALVCVAVAGLAGCSSDDDANATGGDGGSDAIASGDGTGGGGDGGAGCITATVTHEGTHGGSLRCGSFTTNPPAGPPAAFTYVHAPVFPQMIRIDNLPGAGTYFTGCYLDVNDSDPISPGLADYVSATVAVTVPASTCGTATIDINEGDGGTTPPVDAGSDTGTGSGDSGSDGGDGG